MAESVWWMGDGETLAEYVPQDLFKGLLERRIAVPPDRAGILLRDGEIVDTFVGGHFAVGGLWTRLKEALVGKHQLRLLVADLRPFRLDVELRGKTRDDVPVAATVHLELQLDPERPANILALVTNDASFTRADVAVRIEPALRTRVFEPAVKDHDAEELRGNTGLQDQIQADALRVVEEQAGDLGLLVRHVNVDWAWTPVEIQAVEQRMQALEEQRRDFEAQRELRELERKRVGTTWTLRVKGDLARVQATEEHDLRMLLLRNELELADVRDTAQRIAEAQELKHRIETEANARRAALEAALETAQNALERERIRQQIRLEEARTDAEIKRMELEIRELETQLEQEQADWATENQLRKLRGVSEIEADRESRATENQIRLTKAQQELKRLMIEKGLDWKQMLALQAGDLPGLVEVFARQMEIEGANLSEKENLLREVIETERQARHDQAAQARHMFDQATTQLASVGTAAAGRAPGDAPPPPPPRQPEAGALVRCPVCGSMVPSGRLCNECGAPLPRP